jgi:hypothetical protein
MPLFYISTNSNVEKPPHFGGGFGMSQQQSIGLDEQRLVVSPRRALHMLDRGRTRLYELIGKGELDSYLDGRSRKITVESIHRHIKRRLTETRSRNTVRPRRERRGLPKSSDSGAAP